MSRDAEENAIAEEQAFLDAALARRDRVAADLTAALAAPATDDVARARLRTLARQHEEITRARDGLVFGRIDGLDGTVRHIGRIGLRDDDEQADPLVLDWRAEAARPFYTATPVDAQGQARRRHIRTTGSVVTGVDDEPLDGASTTELVGEAALLAALDQRRTGKMSTSISTLQREQDDIIRAGASGPLIVQGGPGTGKTVVALHRVAYLLFTHRRMAEQAVLLLGPSPRFLDYIAQVLPALGETAAVSATCDTLFPGVTVERDEPREVSEIKGRALWQPMLQRYVRALHPRPRDLTLRWEGEAYVIGEPAVAAALTSATSGRPYHRARAAFAEQVHQLLADAVAQRRADLLDEMEEGLEELLAQFDRRAKTRVDPDRHAGSDVDGQMSDDEIDELRERIADSAAVAAFLETWWPSRDPATALRRLLGDAPLMLRLTPDLSEAEAALVAAEPDPWASSDIPLLDAVADLLGDVAAPEQQGEFTADRARRQRAWVYGHVVVDEAQELSDMQWHMVLRRCPSRSITAVGDIDQTEASHRHTSWAEAVAATMGERWTAAELTICYRTPREVMELTGPVLAKAGSRNAPPRAVRSSGIDPWELAVAETALPAAVEAAVAELRQRWEGGSVGVVAPVTRTAALRDLLPGLPVLTATQAKGLEWDAALVVDPDGIAAEPRGWNGLYVALTRCTQELGRILPTPV
ncbi:AAA family ATPase [Actinoplanes sp. NBRC 101535]|uniref:HelD family protein n=1 Tax=Actinoplanes sp. NBRC 101535 TaxID=3032196 RepID=UPI0024A3C8F5|nr:AAA family ATPase [Actinoplanes sp. NBRC 101535]GLY06512.1 DNA helicase [Actinoplanes sp. NBRC 101535]